MGPLVAAAAEHAAEVLAAKRQVALVTGSGLGSQPAADPLDKNAPWYDSIFLKACRREPTSVTPVWLMRQAGRYMEEYRQVRGQTSIRDLCKNPPLCREIMCTAVKRLGVDAAIIFSDLLPILEPMGLELDFVFETVRRTRADLPGDIPLIGFAGAPFTLASYTIEGGSSRS